jgi:ferrochelatase
MGPRFGGRTHPLPRTVLTTHLCHVRLVLDFFSTMDTSTHPERLAVVLFQLGGPDAPEAVEPFLYNLFRDPDIIDFPFARLAREPLARLVAANRAKKVTAHYAHLFEKFHGSPLNNNTRQQAEALERELRPVFGEETRVIVAMRYWHPLTSEAAVTVAAGHFDCIVLLPLYPQYSKTTTGSSLNEWYRQFRQDGVPMVTVEEFHDYGPYIAAQVERVNEALAQFPAGEPVELVFSAHGTPAHLAESGDPYAAQVAETTRLTLVDGYKHHGWTHPHRICYQSKVGPGRWLQPSLTTTLRDLAAQHAKNVLVIPIAFVSDHIETLEEIGHDARDLALSLGIQRFAMTEGLNDSPLFIRALAQLVRDHVDLSAVLFEAANVANQLS